VCSFAVSIKFKLGFDDALDVVGVHFVGGLVGSLLIGFFADPKGFGLDFKAGLFFGGGVGLLGEQLLANGVTIVFSFIVTFAIAKALDATIGLRVSPEVESEGLDVVEHAETAYNYGERAMGRAL
nr:ammonium transporter [Microthrixaceae bacterium]